MVRRPDSQYQPGDGGLELPRQGYCETAWLGPGVCPSHCPHSRRPHRDQPGVPGCRPPAIAGRDREMRRFPWLIPVIACALLVALLAAKAATSAPAFAQDPASPGDITVSVSKSEVSTLTGKTFTFTS